MAVSARPPTDPSEPTSAHQLARRHARRRGNVSRPRHPVWRVIREFVIVIVLALVISAALRAFIIQAFYVPSPSMVSTLQPGDRIIAVKPRLGPVSRGEVIVFKDPGGWLGEPQPIDGWRGTLTDALTFIGFLPSDSGDDLVKRVIGTAGDRVACCDAQGRIVVNGIALNEPYVEGSTDQVRFDVVVPPDSVFVMGDNRADSRDSRFFLDQDLGTVPTDHIVGRAHAIIWPFDRWQVIEIPEEFDRVPRG